MHIVFFLIRLKTSYKKNTYKCSKNSYVLSSSTISIRPSLFLFMTPTPLLPILLIKDVVSGHSIEQKIVFLSGSIKKYLVFFI